MRPGAVAYYMREVALGLHAVHQCGVVHRDIKPDNIMVDTHGQTKIADFGLARGQDSGHEQVFGARHRDAIEMDDRALEAIGRDGANVAVLPHDPGSKFFQPGQVHLDRPRPDGAAARQ